MSKTKEKPKFELIHGNGNSNDYSMLDEAMMKMENEETNNVVSIDSNLPHAIQEVICLHCLARWISVRPQGTYMKDMECPKCGKIGGIISTGEIIDDMW